MQPTRYVLAPDGLPARVVGPWVERKVHFVDRYAHIFATGMKNRFARRVYLELFSGPGLSYDRGQHRFIEGSAIRAQEAPFTDFIYVDIEPTILDVLKQRIDARGDQRPVRYIPGDCNVVIDQVVAQIPRWALTLAFIDPTNWQSRFETIEKLAKAGRVDLLFTFHVGSMKRVADRAVPDVDAFFHTSEWKRALLLPPREERGEALLRLYNRQLKPLGYQPSCYQHYRAIKNRKNVVMYVLVLFSKHARGTEFWEKALKVDEVGQRELPLEF